MITRLLPLGLLIALSACGNQPTPYNSERIQACINASDKSPAAIKACGEAYGQKQ